MRKGYFLYLITALVCWIFLGSPKTEAESGWPGVRLRETEKSESGQARMNLDFLGIGGKIGFVDPEGNIESTVGLGFHADLGTIIPTLKLEGNIDYWSKTQDGRRQDFRYEEYNRDLSFGLTIKHPFPVEGSLTPYAGGGFGFHLVREERDYERDAPHDDWDKSDIHLGLHGVGGAEGRFSPQMKGVVEVRYTLNDPSNFGIFFGVTYLLKR